MCIAIAVGCVPYLDRENWSYVAGPLFTLVSGLLFIVAIRFQIREHKLALAELIQTNVNHAELARIAKQEKEFDTCLRAYAHLKECWELLRSGPKPEHAGSLKFWDHVHQQGVEMYKHSTFYGTTGRFWLFQQEEFNRDRLPPFFLQVREVVYTMKWLVASIRSKTLSPDDRLHLLTLIRTLQSDAHERIWHWLKEVIAIINLLMELPPPEDQKTIDKAKLADARDRYLEALLNDLNEAELGLTELESEVGQPMGWFETPRIDRDVL